MNDKLYFPGLHGIRFFAAFFVIIGHVEVFRQLHNLPNINIIINSIAHIGVDIFFTLSGFLITYLLLKENQIF